MAYALDDLDAFRNHTAATRPYRYAAARLAVEHAERRLQQAVASFVESLDAPSERRDSLAEPLSRRLAALREAAAPAGNAPAG